mgnify:CR=1 FL=1
MFQLIHRPETNGFRLLRAVGSTISLFGLFLVGLALAAGVAAIVADLHIGFGTFNVGFLMLWLLLVGIGILAAGQVLHLLVAFWRAPDRRD